jgi:hypothetical protein
VLEVVMAEQIATTENHRSRRGGFSYRIRLFLYITMGVCAALVLPGAAYVTAIVLGAGSGLFVIIGPLILMQFLLILLIPSLRRKLLQSGRRISDVNRAV